MTGKKVTGLTISGAIRAKAAPAALFALLLATAGTAQAGYSVETFANTGRSYLRGCAATYNSGTVGAAFINNDGGRSPCVPSGYTYQTVTVDGSTDTTGTLTAAWDTSSVVAGADAAYASAAADLSKGEIKLYSSAANFSESNASARLSDTLHFTVAGAAADTVTLIPVTFSFDGAMPADSDPIRASAELNFGFGFGNAQFYEFGDYGAGYFGYNGAYPEFTFAGDPRVNGWASYSIDSYDPLNTQFTGYYAIVGASADVAIDFTFGLRTSNATLDYLNTGKIRIGAIDGVSYTSDSGVFLTGIPTGGAGGVPEPAAWALMIAGFGLVGGAARRGKARAGTLVAC